jgi:muramidase (phage lysozyme)
MPQGTRSINYEANVNVKAFLKLIRYAENGSESDSVYYKLYGGKREFTDTSTHPLEEPIEAWGYKSTAAGAYQILNSTWKQAKKEGVATDFTPFSQDKVAIWIIQKSGAMRYVLDANIEEAIAHLRLQWTSLPGSRQQEIAMPQAKQLFGKYVAEFSKR